MRLAEWDSYEQYREAQVRKHDKKANNIWVRSTELRIAVSILTQYLSLQDIKGICHGVRTGREVSCFATFLNLPEENIIGTDIAVKPFGNIYRHDFHDEHEEWLGIFDFVYSNSLDHAYDPLLALQRWAGQLKPGGILLLHWSPIHNRRCEGF